MEKSCKEPKTWNGSVALHLGSQKYYSLADDFDDSSVSHALQRSGLVDEISKKLCAARGGSSSRQRRTSVFTSWYMRSQGGHLVEVERELSRISGFSSPSSKRNLDEELDDDDDVRVHIESVRSARI